MPQEEQAPPEQTRGRKSTNRKILLIVAVILLAEAGAIVGVMHFVSGPAAVDASHVPAEVKSGADHQIIETLILDAKLPNNRTGVTFLYDTEIYLQTRQKHVHLVQQELDQFQNEIRAEITAVWRAAEPHHLQEPNLENLTRKVTGLLGQRLGTDPETGDPIVHKAVIVMGTGFRIDS